MGEKEGSKLIAVQFPLEENSLSYSKANDAVKQQNILPNTARGLEE
jgi:hypothetical protein